MGLVTHTGMYIARGVYWVQWNGLKNSASVGDWVSLPHLPDRTLTVSGAWGAGATIILQGSNALMSNLSSGVAGFTLNDSRGVGNAISLTTGKAVVVLENTNAIRPVITSLTSTVTPKLTVRVVAESRFR